ncbi:MAG TPA: hypothetical protein VMA71_05735 [Alloacidobacterium sp.]|nr:hypothetical protein [Alloacidobacterium sp.]
MHAIQTACLAIAAILPLISSYAQTCFPPPGFVDTPAPAIAPAEELVSHTEEITIDRPLAVVLNAGNKPLKDTIHKTSGLPGVSGDYMLTKGTFGLPGSRRLTCLTDGSTLEEQVLERTVTNNTFHFRYVVWNYTSPVARPINYGVGDFHDTEEGNGHTHVIWSYSFQLNEQRFPGDLGALGRFLFRVGFLDCQYAAMMRGTLEDSKRGAEQ